MYGSLGFGRGMGLINFIMGCGTKEMSGKINT